jgi:hypothetical protein
MGFDLRLQDLQLKCHPLLLEPQPRDLAFMELRADLACALPEHENRARYRADREPAERAWKERLERDGRPDAPLEPQHGPFAHAGASEYGACEQRAPQQEVANRHAAGQGHHQQNHRDDYQLVPETARPGARNGHG